jgi:foldase protein PrsA
MKQKKKIVLDITNFLKRRKRGPLTPSIIIAILVLLILQEAKKQKVVISQEEIDQKMKELEDNFTSQGQNLDELLEAQNMTRNQLKEQIEIQLIIEKIVSQDVEVTDEEIATYFEANSDYFPEGSDLESVKEDIKQQLQQQKSSDLVQSWLDSLQENAQINYF